MKNLTAVAENVLKQLKKEKKIHLFEDDQYAVGSYLKKKRIDSNLTQQEAAMNTCSHSYLSKLESNKIKPNMECVLKLFSKLHIDKATIYLVENNCEMLKECYESFFYQDLGRYQKLYNKVRTIKENQFSDTIKLGYYLLNNKNKKALDIVMYYASLLGTLTTSNFYIFSLFSAIALERMGSFIEAYKIVNEIISKNTDELLNTMSKEVLFNLCVDLNRPTIGFIVYKELELLYSKYNLLDKLDNIKIGYFELLFNQKEYLYLLSETKEIKLNNKSIYNDKLNYMIGISYFYLEKYNESRKYLSNISTTSIYYSLSVFERERLYLGDNQKFIDETLDLSLINPSFYYTYYLKFKNNELDRKTFNNVEYHDFYKTANYALKKKLLELQLNYYESIFKYKEANRIHKCIENLLSLD